MDTEEIRKELFCLRDTKYREFQIKLIPMVVPETVIGVRTPELRSFAGKLYKNNEASCFLSELPHKYFDENQLHAFIISKEKVFDNCITLTSAFLPYIDNWATCDQLSPAAFKKEPEKLKPYIMEWIRSDHTYTVRFAIGMLMKYFLDDKFDVRYCDAVVSVRSDEYYIRMMIAWYFATALAKQYTSVIPYLENRKLDLWTHNKAIQKSIESYRISAVQKEYLKSLKQ